jgi:16S rRNA (guanine527-N7)-methyltransferase
MQSFDRRLNIIRELGFREEGLPLLKAYLELLWSSNEELNLISRKMSQEDLVDNHLIDCLLPLKNFPAGIKSAADFGAGGGLPGVVYALQFPDISYHLFEKSPKKQEFLRRCSLLAPNVVIRAEIARELDEIELVTARAFKPLDVILELSRSYFARQGRYFLLKGRREKIDEELLQARKKFKSLKAEVIPLQSPVAEVERHLVLI